MSNVENPKSPLDEFLNPKSMLTPGLAGAVTMLITNTLAIQFGLLPNYTGLLISFLLGLLVFLSQSNVSLPARFLYYFLNSLVIFSVAMGANQTGVTVATATEKEATKQSDQKLAASEPFFSHWLDGTVPLRRRVSSEIASRVTPDQARHALTELRIPSVGADPVKHLERHVRSARSADVIKQVQSALANAPGTEETGHGSTL
jgi:hypothetical protein